MIAHKAKIIAREGEHYLSLEMIDNTLDIPITQDEPNDILEVFNKLILALKNGVFEFEMEEVDDDDIIHQVGKLYISQLNSELSDIYSEMSDYDLLEKGE